MAYYNKSMKKDVLINLRVESELKERFQEIAESNGYTMSELLTASMKEIVRRGAIPINLYGKLPHNDRSIISIPDIKRMVEQIIVSKGCEDKIQSVAIFGSYAKGKAKPTSDIDLMMTCDKEDTFSLLSLEDDLKQLFGKKVDLVINPDQNSYFGKVINNEKIVIYEK